MDSDKYKKAIIAAATLTDTHFPNASKMDRSWVFVSFLTGSVADTDLELARIINSVYGTSKMPSYLCTPSLPGRL